MAYCMSLIDAYTKKSALLTDPGFLEFIEFSRKLFQIVNLYVAISPLKCQKYNFNW